LQSGCRRERRIEIRVAARMKEMELDPESTSLRLHASYYRLGESRMGRVDQQSKAGAVG